MKNKIVESSSSSSSSLSFKYTMIIFSLFFISSILSALYNRIIDCDEYMNYWEPTHYLLYNKGLQTWEYSPVYSLRSYVYLLIHSTIGKILTPFSNSNKIILFYLIKIGIGFFNSIAQTIFFKGVRQMFGKEISLYTMIFMLFSPAFFLSSSNFLPTSFSMITFMASYGYWMIVQSNNNNNNKNSNSGNKESIYSVFLSATSVFLGWPFVIVLIVPIALNLIYRFGFIKVLIWALIPVITVFIPMIIIDYQYYGKLVIAIFNIIAYNFTSNHSGGSQLYGIEDWPFYFINAFINYNIVFLLSLLTIPMILIFRKFSGNNLKNLSLFSIILTLCPYYMWFGFMTYLPHKEERFLFVIYPLIALSGSISFYIGLNVLNSIISYLFGNGSNNVGNSKKDDDFDKKQNKLKQQQKQQKQQLNNNCQYYKIVKFIKFSILICFILISISRIYSTYINYTAPIDTFTYLNNDILLNGNVNHPNFPHHILKKSSTSTSSVNVCVGKEWHRYPSNFFLPNDNNGIEFNLKFIESDFKGHLPKPFSTLLNGTSIIPTNMNDQNKQEFDRYIKPNECSYIVDFDSPTQNEEHYVNDVLNWKIIYSTKFLDVSLTNNSLRAFWIPKLSLQKNVYNNYYILEKL